MQLVVLGPPVLDLSDGQEDREPHLCKLFAWLHLQFVSVGSDRFDVHPRVVYMDVVMLRGGVKSELMRFREEIQIGTKPARSGNHAAWAHTNTRGAC